MKLIPNIFFLCSSHCLISAPPRRPLMKFNFERRHFVQLLHVSPKDIKLSSLLNCSAQFGLKNVLTCIREERQSNWQQWRSDGWRQINQCLLGFTYENVRSSKNSSTSCHSFIKIATTITLWWRQTLLYWDRWDNRRLTCISCSTDSLTNGVLGDQRHLVENACWHEASHPEKKFKKTSL